jgi:hypothetical protein
MVPRRATTLCPLPLLVLVAIAACGGGPRSVVDRVAAARSDQARRAARTAGLPAPVQAFLADAAGAAGHRFTVTYAGPGEGTTTLVQRPPSRRVDVRTAEGTESFVHVGDGSWACRQPPGQGWTCERRTVVTDPDLGLFSAESIDQVVAALGRSRHEFRFEVGDEMVAGTPARCLVTTPLVGGREGRLCIARRSGAVLLVDTEQRQLRATRYREVAPAQAVEVPTTAGRTG